MLAVVALWAAPLATQGSLAIAAEKPPQSWDGLERRASKKLDNLYVRPNVEFKTYKSVKIDPVQVSFDKNWDPNRDKRGVSGRVSADDMQRIRADLAKLFHKVLTDRLAKGGYAVVEAAGDDVLQVQPAITNLYINAPDVATAGRTRSFTMEAGRMTLVMQLSDSTTGQILARVVDTQTGTNTGQMRWSNSVTNSAEAQIAIERWANALRNGLDGVNGKE